MDAGPPDGNSKVKTSNTLGLQGLVRWGQAPDTIFAKTAANKGEGKGSEGIKGDAANKGNKDGISKGKGELRMRQSST